MILNRYVCLFSLLLCCNSIATAAPVAEWRFDELFWNSTAGEVKDNTGNGLHGKAMFGAYTDVTDPAIAGTFGTCRYGVFDGNAGTAKNHHIKLLDDPALNSISNELTLTAWVKLSASGWYNYIISNDRDSSAKGFSLRFSNDNRLFFTIWDAAGANHSLSGITQLNLDQWYHVAATFDGSVMRVYVDGLLDRSTNYSGTIGTPSSFDTALGGMGYKPNTYNFTGSLDEVRVYDEVLDQTALQSIMAETHSCDGTCDLSGDYLLFEDHFDDGDYSGWEVHRFNGKGCDWTVEGGQLKEQRNSCYGFLGNDLLSSEENLTNYVIKAHIDARPTGGNNGVGLVFGYTDDSNYYLVRWHDYGTIYTSNSKHRDFELIKVSSGITTTLDIKTQLVLPDSFDITVDVSDGRGIDVFVNCDRLTLGLHADGEYPAIKEFGLYTRDNDSAVFYDDVEIYGKLSTLPDSLAEWHMDAAVWNGTNDEVIDASGNSLHGTSLSGAVTDNANPAIAGTVGTCGYGVFDTAASDLKRYINLGIDPAINEISDAVTIAGWVNIESSSHYNYIFSNARGYLAAAGFELRILNNNRPYFSIYDDSGVGHHVGGSVGVTLGSWNHIAAIFDGTKMSMYVNGVLTATTPFIGTIGIPSPYNAVLGSMARFDGTYNLNGFLDEMYLYDQALTDSQIKTLMEKQHGCGSSGVLDHFKISHDGAGIHCLSEDVLVTAKDGNSDNLTSYTGTITLDSQTGTGNWIATTGSGVLTDSAVNDGLATYTFDPADNGATTFTLSYEDGQAVFNIDVYDGAIRDDDSEEDFTFAANGFLLTANPVSNPPPVTINDPILTQISGQDFSVYMTAYGQSATHPECGIIENYTGNKTIRFAGDYRNPTSGTLDINVNGSAIRMGDLDPGQTINFVNGKAQITANYTDAGKVRIRAYDTTEADNVYGATNDFVVKPAGFDFSIKRSSDSFLNPAATDENGLVFVAAGEDFDVEVRPTNLNGDTTPNYGNESTPESIKILHSLVAPVSGDPGALSGTLAAQGSGVFSSTFNWSEVGIIDLAASVADSDYLVVGDINATSGNVGRFMPHHFEVSNKLSGALDVSCPSGGGFNYIGQQFGYAAGNQPEFQIEAKNLVGETTLNYSGSFAKLGIGGISIPQISQDGSNSMTITHQQATASFSSVSNGVFKYSFGADQFTYDRTNTPVGSFDSDIDIVIASITDTDDVADNFVSEILEPSATNMRYGRLMIDSAFGSELVDLVLPIKVQFYDSGIGDFVTHTDDTCSSFSVLPLEMLDTLNPASLTTSLSSLAAGEATLTISAPGAGNTGSLGVVLNAPTWLEFDWGRPVGESNRFEPKATASFGIYSGNDAFIYRREIR